MSKGKALVLTLITLLLLVLLAAAVPSGPILKSAMELW